MALTAFREGGEQFLRSLLGGAGRQLDPAQVRAALSGARQLPPDLSAQVGIVRNAMSNVDNIPPTLAENLGLGPASNRIAREAYGGDGPVRGGLIGTRDISAIEGQAPVPQWGRGQVPEGLGGGLPSRAQLSSTNPNYFPDVVVRETGTTAGAVQPRLDLRSPAGSSSSRSYTTSRGAVRPEGTPQGGRMYSPEAMSRETNMFPGPSIMDDVPQTLIPEVSPGQTSINFGRKIFVPEIDQSGGMIRKTGGSSTRQGGGAIVRSGPGAVSTGEEFTNIPIDVQVLERAGLNPAAVGASNVGAMQIDLNDPLVQNLLRGAGAVTGGAAFGFGVGQMSQGDVRREEQGQVPMTGAEDAEPPRNEPGSVIQETEAAGPVLVRDNDGSVVSDSDRPTVQPSSPNTIVTRGDQGASDRRAALQQSDPARATAERFAEPMDPSKYSSPAEYFAAVRNYATQSDVREMMREAGIRLAAQRGTDADLGAWAASNPQLMYELQRQSMAAPQLSEQSGDSVTTTQTVSSLGGDSNASAIGYGAYGAAAAQGDIQASDIAAAAAPLPLPKLERKGDLLLEEALANVTRFRAN